MQVAVKYRRNVSSLSIDMSADDQTTTLGRHIDQHISRYVDRHISVDISADISVDISTDTRPICRSIHRPRVGRYVYRNISRGVHKIHMIQFLWGHLQSPFSSEHAIENPRRRLIHLFWSCRETNLFWKNFKIGYLKMSYHWNLIALYHRPQFLV